MLPPPAAPLVRAGWRHAPTSPAPQSTLITHTTVFRLLAGGVLVLTAVAALTALLRPPLDPLATQPARRELGPAPFSTMAAVRPIKQVVRGSKMMEGAGVRICRSERLCCRQCCWCCSPPHLPFAFFLQDHRHPRAEESRLAFRLGSLSWPWPGWTPVPSLPGLLTDQLLAASLLGPTSHSTSCLTTWLGPCALPAPQIPS